MGLLDKLFGYMERDETIEDAVNYEQLDEETDIDSANEALFNREDGDDCIPEGKYCPPPQKVWWRV